MIIISQSNALEVLLEGMTILQLILPSTINKPILAFLFCLMPSSHIVKLHHSEASAGNGVVRVCYDCEIQESSAQLADYMSDSE